MPTDGRDGMLFWLGLAARTAREERDRLQVHIAAELGVRQETVGRFEQGKQWPRDPDRMIAAYAHDLDMDSVELWKDALRRWEESQ